MMSTPVSAVVQRRELWLVQACPEPAWRRLSVGAADAEHGQLRGIVSRQEKLVRRLKELEEERRKSRGTNSVVIWLS